LAFKHISYGSVPEVIAKNRGVRSFTAQALVS
jgi:hypothetical protein